MVSSGKQARISFGPFCLMPSARLLSRDGVPVEIGGRSFDILATLIEQPGQVVSKRDLLKKVWPDVVVEDGSLRFHMAGLRKLLGDGEEGARYIATQVGVGYAFVAPVEHALVSPSAPDVEEHGGNCDMGDLSRLLPTRPAHIVGRQEDLELLTGRIVNTPLFTIVGPAGVGKTTLAVETAHALLGEFAGNVAFVDLAMLEDVNLVSSAIAGALGIPVQVDDPMVVILRHIRDQRLLLIIDNCEHVIDAVAAIVERISADAPSVHILATSREPLRSSTEHVHWLGALDFPEEVEAMPLSVLLEYPAVALFAERARAGNSTLEIGVGEARLIADMCQRLDGIALPIELAAVRAASHGLEATARLLGDRFSLGWAGRRTAKPRHQTLYAALDWSYELLSDAEKTIFERLAVFLGPFDAEAAAGICADEALGEEAAVSALDRLVNKSLVSLDRTGGQGTYRLLEMVRAYAREKLAEQQWSTVQDAHRRHAAYYLHLLQVTDQPIANIFAKGTGRLGNIRSALDWSFGPDGDRAIAVPLAAEAAAGFLHLSLLVECRTWCARAIEEPGDMFRATKTELELQAALGLALMFTRGNGDAAEAALLRSLAIASDLDDRWSQLRILGRLHIFHERIGDFARARDWSSRAVEVADAIGEPEAIAVAASMSGISLHLAGRQIEARAEFEKALRNSLPSERARTIHYGFDHRNRSRIGLARTLWILGYPDQARSHAEDAIDQAARLDHAATYCIALIWALSVYIWSGDYSQAAATLEKFEACAHLNAFEPYIVATPGIRQSIAIRAGAAPRSLEPVEESLARLHAARYELLTTSFEIVLTRGLNAIGRSAEALQLVDSAIQRCESNGERLALAELLRTKSAVIGTLTPSDASARETLLREALDISRDQGARAWELRSAIDLARLLADLERADEGYTLLQPLRDRFLEGADTADVRLADDMLGDLAASV